MDGKDEGKTTDERPSGGERKEGEREEAIQLSPTIYMVLDQVTSRMLSTLHHYYREGFEGADPLCT